jgi:hypothetical protein
MASIIVTRGLQITGGRLSTTVDAFQALQSLAVDDRATGFAAGDTSLNSPANVAVVAFDSTPTRSGQTVTHLGTFATGAANFIIKRISLHNAAFGSVTASSTTLYGGIDGQSITKTSDFTVTFTIRITQSDAS